MKKFLSLMLAMIMVMSLVTVGAGAADFTDAADIEQKEAVALLSGLGILEGPGDGTFNPKGTITRGAAAKILTWLLEGEAKADAIKAAGVKESPFSDVPTTSSNVAFIKYCFDKGIVSGRSDGTFRRADGLTGNAFLKMVLVALGVTDIDFNTTTNPGWTIDAQARATEMGLLEGIDEDYVYSNQLTRENACQIAMNALNYAPNAKSYYPVLKDGKTEVMQCETQADAVLYASVLGGADKGYTPGTKVTEKSNSLGAKVYNLGEYTGIVTSNAAVDATIANAGKTTVAGAEDPFEFTSGLELIGHKVTVYYNTKTDDVYAVYDKSTTLELTKDVKAEDQLAAALGVKVAKLPAKFSYTKYDGTYAESAVAEQALLASKKATVTGTLIIADGAVIGLVEPATKILAKVSDIITTKDSEAIELTGYEKAFANTAKEDAIKEYADIAEGDYVVVTQAKEVATIAKAETVTGKPTKIADKKVTINGVEYDQFGSAQAGLTEVKADKMEFSKEYTLYLDGQGNYIVATAKDVTTTETVVFFVKGYTVPGGTTGAYGQTTDDTHFVQCIDLNGNEVIYQTKTLTEKDKGLYTVTTKTENKVKYATFESTGTKSTAAIAAKDLKIGTNEYFTDGVKFISVTGELDKVKVTVKDGVQKVDATYTVEESTKPLEKFYVAEAVKDAAGDETGNYTIAYVFVAGAFAKADAETVKDVVYAAEKDTATFTKVPYVDGSSTKTGYEHTVYINDEKTTIVTTAGTALKGFIQLTKVVDGVYKAESYEKLPGNVQDPAVIENMYNGMMTAGKAEDIDVTDVTVVNVSGNTKVPTDATKLSDKDTVALVFTNDKCEEIALIYVTGSTRS